MKDKSIEAYNKIIKVIDSCQTVDHINCAWLMIMRFNVLFVKSKSGSDSLSELMALEQSMGLRLYILHKIMVIVKV